MSVAALLLAGLWPVGTPTDGDAVQLVWSAPASCPDAMAVRDAVDRLLGDSGADRSEVSARADVRRESGSFALRLELSQDGSTSTRALSTRTCSEAVDAAALLIAIAIDPSTAPSISPEPEPEPEPSVLPEPEEQPEPEPPPGRASPSEPNAEPASTSAVDADASRRTEGRRLRFTPRVQAFARGGASFGLTPGWGGFVEVGVGTAWRFIEVHAAASGWLPRRERVGDIEGRFQLWAGGLRGCPVLRPHPRIDVPLCVGLHAGAMLGRGLRGLDGQREAQPWVGASLGPRLRVRIQEWIGLHVGADGWLSVVRPAFDTEQGTLVHRADRFGATIGLGIVIGRAPASSVIPAPPGRTEK